MTRLGKLGTFLTIATIGAALSANAALTWTGPLTLSSHDVVGFVVTVKGDTAKGTMATEFAFAEALLQKAPNSSGNLVVNTLAHPYARGPENPSTWQSILIAGAKKLETGPNVPGGWEYAMAKYGGPNGSGGYILFHLDGSSAVLPQYGAELLWNKKSDDSYGLSGFTLFNPIIPEPTTILAGLMLLLPFGASAIRIMRNRK